jgi:WD40 repeat protein
MSLHYSVIFSTAFQSNLDLLYFLMIFHQHGSSHELPHFVAPEKPQLLWMYEHPSKVNCVAISPDGSMIASGNEDRGATIQLYDAYTHKLLVKERISALTTINDGSTHDDGGGIMGLAFAPDNTRLVSAGGDRIIRIWSIISGTVLDTTVDGVDNTNRTRKCARISSTSITERSYVLCTITSCSPVWRHCGQRWW